MNDIERMVRAALKLQPSIAAKIPEEKKRLGEGRKAKLVVDDPTGVNHTVMYFMVKDGLLHELEKPPPDIRNEVIFKGEPLFGYTGVMVFRDLVDGTISVREAVSERWVVVTAELAGVMASYDEEEMMQLVETLLENIRKVLKLKIG